MLLPLATDVVKRVPPVANWAIIAASAFVFVYVGAANDLPRGHEMVLDGLTLTGLFGHVWLHGDLLHLVGNMIFLGIFGGAVCSRIGNLWYPILYVGLGVAAGAAHALVGGGPAVGASGAINGVVGMFAVLFPASSLEMALIIPVVAWWKTFRVPAAIAIVLWFAMDVHGAITAGGRIGYWAHLGGFFAGFGLACLVVVKGWVRMLPDERTLLEVAGAPPAPRDPARASAARTPAPAAPPAPRPAAAAVRQAAPTGIQFRCATCGTSLERPKEEAGRPVACPGCRRLLRVPGG
jgi:membrane associated rhomboid family serine protease/DNA-directed RNA polymerase subunit RPC12/RpoP